MFDIMVPKDPAKIKKSPVLSFITSFSLRVAAHRVPGVPRLRRRA